VPNVLYSCGPVAHDGVLWVPYGVGDSRIEVCSLMIEDLLDAMVLQEPAVPAPA
jgi:predicted GH43/DUF377 family glycosyl hydrolase